jgi:DNA repair protein RadD
MSTLREYQTKAVDQIEAAINAKQAPLYVLPTGGGKTVVATAIIERAAQAGHAFLC